MYKLSGKRYLLNIAEKDGVCFIDSGNLGEFECLKTHIFEITLRNLSNNEEVVITSTEFMCLSVIEDKNKFGFVFEGKNEYKNIKVYVNAVFDEEKIIWTENVENKNEDFSVMEITYPLPVMKNEKFNLFHADESGKVVENAGKKEYAKCSLYPAHHFSMQYFAVYGEKNGVYFGIEDEDACVKNFNIKCKNDIMNAKVSFYGIDGSKKANSFKVSGVSKWQIFDGDWYDATLIYKDFILKKAKWLPEIDENGRKDTHKKFKEVPFIVADYIPNSEYQRDNKPMSLSAGSDKTYPEYWYEAVIKLQKELGVPISYHVYNWHEIPFNIEYPHFIPAKDGFIEGVKKLQENNIYVMPYINAVSWEANDDEPQRHKVTYKNTGYKGAVIKKDGTEDIVIYPQTTISGKMSHLVPICPSFETWHDIIYDVTRKLENEYGVDGVYFDQVSAHNATPCYNKSHSHKLGGGSFWADGYNKMMKKINKDKKEDVYYFSECNAEPYLKSFDGFLTWTWVDNGEVPAFPLVYSGYIQFVGRFCMGAKKDDYDFFKYVTAMSLMCGQQIGWCKAEVVFDEKRMKFLKTIVDARYKYTDLFNAGTMLRPPCVTSNIEDVVTSPALWFEEELVMKQLHASAWKNKEKTVIFLVNASDDEAEYTLEFDMEEYGLKNVPSDFCADDNKCTIKGVIKGGECKIWEI
ncbi:MAG: hypothetical protein E7391_09210 [Ruminococcaceae bacterium]|nr:hypothetical protein [Oscillospiraceae bacterium]